MWPLGPILAALGATATISPTALLTQLVLVVGLPLGAGMTTRATLRPTRSLLSACAALGTLALLVLLWQVTSQITLQAAYVPVTLALLAFLAGSAALGWLLTLGLPPPRRLALASRSPCATSPSPPASPPPPSAPPPLHH